MSVARKSDVKNHLSAHGRAGNGPFLSVSHPDATGQSAVEADEVKVDPSSFANDFLEEHVEHGTAPLPTPLSSPQK